MKLLSCLLAMAMLGLAGEVPSAAGSWGAVDGESNGLLLNGARYIDNRDGNRRRLGGFLQALVGRLAVASPEPLLVLRVQVLANDTANAYADCLKNQLVINSGILEMVDNVDQLAVLLGHEIGHCLIDLRHFASPQREPEIAADAWSVALARRAGFDAAAALTLARRKQVQEAATAVSPRSWERRLEALSLWLREPSGVAPLPLPFSRQHLRRLSPFRGLLSDLETGRYEGVASRLAGVLEQLRSWRDLLVPAGRAFSCNRALSDLLQELRASAPNLPLPELQGMAGRLRPELSAYGLSATASLAGEWRGFLGHDLLRLVRMRQQALAMAAR